MNARQDRRGASAPVSARTPLGIEIYQPTRLDAVCKYTVGSFLAAGAAFAAVNLSASPASADDFGGFSGSLFTGSDFGLGGTYDFGSVAPAVVDFAPSLSVPVPAPAPQVAVATPELAPAPTSGPVVFSVPAQEQLLQVQAPLAGELVGDAALVPVIDQAAGISPAVVAALADQGIAPASPEGTPSTQVDALGGLSSTATISAQVLGTTPSTAGQDSAFADPNQFQPVNPTQPVQFSDDPSLVAQGTFTAPAEAPIPAANGGTGYVSATANGNGGSAVTGGVNIPVTVGEAGIGVNINPSVTTSGGKSTENLAVTAVIPGGTTLAADTNGSLGASQTFTDENGVAVANLGVSLNPQDQVGVTVSAINPFGLGSDTAISVSENLSTNQAAFGATKGEVTLSGNTQGVGASYVPKGGGLGANISSANGGTVGLNYQFGSGPAAMAPTGDSSVSVSSNPVSFPDDSGATPTVVGEIITGADSAGWSLGADGLLIQTNTPTINFTTTSPAPASAPAATGNAFELLPEGTALYTTEATQFSTESALPASVLNSTQLGAFEIASAFPAQAGTQDGGPAGALTLAELPNTLTPEETTTPDIGFALTSPTNAASSPATTSPATDQVLAFTDRNVTVGTIEGIPFDTDGIPFDSAAPAQFGTTNILPQVVLDSVDEENLPAALDYYQKYITSSVEDVLAFDPSTIKVGTIEGIPFDADGVPLDTAGPSQFGTTNLLPQMVLDSNEEADLPAVLSKYQGYINDSLQPQDETFTPLTSSVDINLTGLGDLTLAPLKMLNPDDINLTGLSGVNLVPQQILNLDNSTTTGSSAFEIPDGVLLDLDASALQFGDLSTTTGGISTATFTAPTNTSFYPPLSDLQTSDLQEIAVGELGTTPLPAALVPAEPFLPAEPLLPRAPRAPEPTTDTNPNTQGVLVAATGLEGLGINFVGPATSELLAQATPTEPTIKFGTGPFTVSVGPEASKLSAGDLRLAPLNSSGPGGLLPAPSSTSAIEFENAGIAGWYDPTSGGQTRGAQVAQAIPAQSPTPGQPSQPAQAAAPMSDFEKWLRYDPSSPNSGVFAGTADNLVGGIVSKEGLIMMNSGLTRNQEVQQLWRDLRDQRLATQSATDRRSDEINAINAASAAAGSDLINQESAVRADALRQNNYNNGVTNLVGMQNGAQERRAATFSQFVYDSRASTPVDLQRFVEVLPDAKIGSAMTRISQLRTDGKNNNQILNTLRTEGYRAEVDKASGYTRSPEAKTAVVDRMLITDPTPVPTAPSVPQPIKRGSEAERGNAEILFNVLTGLEVPVVPTSPSPTFGLSPIPAPMTDEQIKKGAEAMQRNMVSGAGNDLIINWGGKIGDGVAPLVGIPVPPSKFTDLYTRNGLFFPPGTFGSATNATSITGNETNRQLASTQLATQYDGLVQAGNYATEQLIKSQADFYKVNDARQQRDTDAYSRARVNVRNSTINGINTSNNNAQADVNATNEMSTATNRYGQQLNQNAIQTDIRLNEASKAQSVIGGYALSPVIRDLEITSPSKFDAAMEVLRQSKAVPNSMQGAQIVRELNKIEPKLGDRARDTPYTGQ